MRGYNDLPLKKFFLSHIVGKIRKGDILCSKQISGIEKLHAEEGGVQG